ncbi:EscR/YscR/HrcR family type III secretion system export apparatus protein [Pantoea sp. Bo_7]|uniref:EscR/YscR/HrcR family type III secretion system export apparatus protein n=1 Tax=unclassified Pantoea TaxID=2630326 RepID=UPI0012329F55|nr:MULTISPECIES: EscR/YscR/HrcR family type III secretion system export apparatus protein [unclassified Pantoea]KAA6043263.1 EscR/YscR/HrcR family type III secretion system export apparatus protein [Pantoea sp. Bo_7]KAA6088247.1 EscR/YscR/HrcR family type III secretion system export apparatus protein [Pantoea sp. Bo_10]
MNDNDIWLIAILAISSLAPFLIACGTCYIKFSIVFIMVRNAIGLQQIPSNMTLNGIALVLAAFVMTPVLKGGYDYYIENNIDLRDRQSTETFLEKGFTGYKEYLIKYTDKDLAQWFDNTRSNISAEERADIDEEERDVSILALLPAYALTEIKEAFKIGFYIYLPFVVIDLLVSSVLLTLGMMMMSPITISVPIKLLLFVVIDGWSIISKGLIEQYLFIAT